MRVNQPCSPVALHGLHLLQRWVGDDILVRASVTAYFILPPGQFGTALNNRPAIG